MFVLDIIVSCTRSWYISWWSMFSSIPVRYLEFTLRKENSRVPALPAILPTRPAKCAQRNRKAGLETYVVSQQWFQGDYHLSWIWIQKFSSEEYATANAACLFERRVPPFRLKQYWFDRSWRACYINGGVDAIIQGSSVRFENAIVVWVQAAAGSSDLGPAAHQNAMWRSLRLCQPTPSRSKACEP